MAARRTDRRTGFAHASAPTCALPAAVPARGAQRPAARRRPHRAARSALDRGPRSAALLVVGSADERSEELVDSLEALGAQVSLAVEGASLAADLHRRQSEARFRSLVAHSSDLITVLDEHGVVTYQSPSIERVLGYRVDEVEGSASTGC